MAAVAVPPVDYDNSNVNYGPKDGYDGSLSDRALIVNGGNLKFEVQYFNTFKIATLGYLNSLHNLDRIVLGVELAPIQVQAESVPNFTKRTNCFLQSKEKTSNRHHSKCNQESYDGNQR